jgi:DNA-binding transcriptional LysR family regulator
MKTNFEELQVLVAVIDEGRLYRAAERLGLTVSAVSRSLARLERKLQTTLLIRTTRRVGLTEEGCAFLKSARAIIDSINNAEENLAKFRTAPIGRLRVTAPSTFMLHALVPVISGFRREYPMIELELSSNDDLRDLLEHRADLLIRMGEVNDHRFNVTPIGNYRHHIVAAPSYLDARTHLNCVSDLLSHSVIGLTQPGSLNEWPLKGIESPSNRITPNVSASSAETLLNLTLAGAGVACLADFATKGALADGRLVKLLPDVTEERHYPINIITHKNSIQTTRKSAFISYLRRAFS